MTGIQGTSSIEKRDHPMRRYLSLIPLLAALAVMACGKGDAEPEPGNGAALDVGTPSFGVYNLLKASGNHVDIGGVKKLPPFEPMGKELSVNGSAIQLFEFPGSTETAAVAATIAPDGSRIGSTEMNWEAPPHFFRTDRVIVLYLGSDSTTVRALTTAIGPQFAGK